MRFDGAQGASEGADARIDGKVLVGQLLHGSVMFASTMLLGVALWRIWSVDEKPEDEIGNMLAVFAVGLAVASCIASIIVPKLYRQQAVRQIMARGAAGGVQKVEGELAEQEKQQSLNDQLVSVRITESILRGAILETPCVLAVVGAFLNAPRWIVVIPLVMLLIMALNIPRKRAIDDWLQQTKREMLSGLT